MKLKIGPIENSDKIIADNGKDAIFLMEDNEVNKLSNINTSNNICPYCDKKFTRSDNMQRHIRTACLYFKIKNIIDKEEGRITQNTDLELPNIFPTISNERQVFYIPAPSGAGKSYFCFEYAKKFKEKFPDKDIILFTCNPEDVHYDDLEDKFEDEFIKISVDDNLLNDKIDVKKELINSLVIFDDVENSTNNNRLNKYMWNLRNDVLERGRDQSMSGKDIYVCCTNHLITDFSKTRSVINEASDIVIYPHGGSNYTNLMKNYIGLGPKQIEKISNIQNSRWVVIHKRYPMYVIYKNGAFLL